MLNFSITFYTLAQNAKQYMCTCSPQIFATLPLLCQPGAAFPHRGGDDEEPPLPLLCFYPPNY